MREPLGNRMDKAREAMRGLPSRPADALAAFSASTKPCRGSKRMAARLTKFSLGLRIAAVKSSRRTGRRYVQNCTQTLLPRNEPPAILAQEELFPQMCYRPFATEFRSFTHVSATATPSDAIGSRDRGGYCGIG